MGRGEFARLAYRLGRARATGVLAVYRSDTAARSPDVFVLRRGNLMAPSKRSGARDERSGSASPRLGSRVAGGAPTTVIRSGFSRVVLDREVARRLAELAGAEGARYTFDGGLAAYPPGAVGRHFSLAAWARSHIEAQLDANRAQRLAAELAGARLKAARDIAPDPALCDETDLRILDAIRVPRRLDQIWSLARTPRYRLLSFLHFLRVVGGVSITGISAPTREPAVAVARGAHEVLGVTADADRVTVKRAYRRLARALHPDLHPDASADHRRALERKLSDVTNAYTVLIGSIPVS